jgi:hypothetical protein
MSISNQSATSAIESISNIRVPNSKLAREIIEFILDTESDLLFNHSSRVYYFGATRGTTKGPRVRS